ncbi:uncharacterized protein LOC129600256 [Paramacrobiotus metropolitanus]|uniref:uncharacterized protein LOC129600256 n=1 Tax=Paramacrobiotus metropolitanus TaxID=2943436 RepID=UPI00244567BA|nr:uncharacterized protein LOC129600256 [Paramacrobiotus metropolitanus]
MLFYGNRKNSVHAWNGVDVLVQGQLQHGNVVNVADQGLIIDFQCATQRAQFIEYGRIFRYNPPATSRPQDAIQALLPRHRDGAWIWYPARIIHGVCKAFDDIMELVEVQGPHGVVRELLSWQQVRVTPTGVTLENWRVKPNDFVVRSCPLSADYSSADLPLLGKTFDNELAGLKEVLYVTRVRQTFFYLQKEECPPLQASDVDNVLCMAQTMAINCGPEGVKKRRVAECLPLPAELLREIFKALDSIERIRCRRVCHLWNTILTTEADFPDVRVSCSADYGHALCAMIGMHWMVAGLLKCLTSATRVLVLRNLELDACVQLLAVVQYVLNGSRLPTLIFSNCHLGDTARSFVSRSVKDIAEMAAGVAVNYGCERETLIMQLWDVFEKNLVLEKPLDRPALAEMIAALNPSAGRQEADDVRDILYGLHAYQSADPRLTTLYRGREWTVQSIGEVDVDELTPLTVAFLGRKSQKINLRIT